MSNWRAGARSRSLTRHVSIKQATPLTLRKESEMYKDMKIKEFNKEVDCMTKDARAQVSLYIAKAIHAFV
jgi:hypothetical protein